MFDMISPHEMVLGILLIAVLFALVGLTVMDWDGKDSSRDHSEDDKNAMDDEHRPPPGPWGGPL